MWKVTRIFSLAFFPPHISMPACLAAPLREAPSREHSEQRVPWGCATWQSHKEEDSVTARRFWKTSHYLETFSI